MANRTKPRGPRRRFMVDAAAMVMAKLDNIRAESERRRPTAKRRKSRKLTATAGRPRLRLADFGRNDEPRARPRLGTPTLSAFHRLSGSETA